MAAATAATQAAKTLIPFRQGCRRRVEPLVIQAGGVVAGALAGEAWSIELPRVGLLETIYLHLAVTNTLAGVPAMAEYGPFDAVKRIEVRTNQGAGILYSTSGYGNYVTQCLMGRMGNPINRADANLYAAPIAAAANAWVLTYVIPVAANFGAENWVGLINLQAPETQVVCSGNYALAGDTTIATLGGGAGLSAATLTASYAFYEVPDPSKVQMPPRLVHRWMESTQAIPAAGEQVITIPREGKLARIAHVVTQTDARNDACTQIRLLANQSDEIYRYARRWDLSIQDQLRTSERLPTGVYVHDLFSATQEPGRGDGRDMLDAQRLSLLESRLTCGANGGTVNEIKTLREFQQRLG